MTPNHPAMDNKTLLDEPIASVRAFGAILISVFDEDPEGMKAALVAATQLARDLERWSAYPYAGSDAALNRVAAMTRSRLATSALSAHDARMLGDLCSRAAAMSRESAPEAHDFELSCMDVERVWNENTVTRG